MNSAWAVSITSAGCPTYAVTFGGFLLFGDRAADLLGRGRRCELAGARRDLLDLDAGTLSIEITHVVVDCRITDLDADRRVANTLAELIIGGALASVEVTTAEGPA
jgi:hypothetical protein